MDAATAVGSASVGAWSATYDAAGNMTCRAATSATTCAGSSPTGAQLGYDNEGRLTSWQNTPSSPTSTAAYLYDGEGNRVAEVAISSSGATTTTAFIGGLEAVTSSGGTTTTTAYYGGGLAESVNGTLSYLLSDPTLGSASASVNLSGAVTASQLYSPYGSMRYQSGILPTDYGFTHQRADAATGLDDYGARSYDPVAGQFTSADTTLAGGLNRYAYVAGNPETRTDPSGHVYAQRTTPYYQNFGAAVYSLIAQDKGKATNGMSTALFIARYDPDAYRSAEAFATAHGVIMMPHVGEDANTYVQTRSNAYWNSSSAAMLEYIQLRALSHDTVVANTGVRSGDLNLFTSEWQPLLRAMGRAGPMGSPLEGDDGDSSGSGGAAGAAAGDGGCGQSFTAETLVATPHGEQPIASLQVGQQVEAYDPATGKTQAQTITRVYLNHDSDRLDVTLAYHVSAAAVASADTGGHGRIARAGQRRQVAGTTTATRATTSTRDEVIHTTSSHPWLTVDEGWLRAGQLHLGEPVRLLDGATATVVALHTLPGVGAMWDLSLDATHTFAVGNIQAVVHNCPVGGSSGSSAGGEPRPTIKVGDLKPIHSPSTAGERPELQNLSDDDLLQAVNNPVNNDPIRINTRTGGVVDGNGRAYELQRRAADPNGTITPDTEVQYEPYVPFTPWDMG